MAVTQQYRFSGLIAVFSLGVIAVAIYLAYPLITDPAESVSAPEYSFEKPGQLKQPENRRVNRFANLSPEELTTSAESIIQQADQLIQDNPVQPVPLTKQQQTELEQKLTTLQHQIEQLEADLKANGQQKQPDKQSNP